MPAGLAPKDANPCHVGEVRQSCKHQFDLLSQPTVTTLVTRMLVLPNTAERHPSSGSGTSITLAPRTAADKTAAKMTSGPWPVRFPAPDRPVGEAPQQKTGIAHAPATGCRMVARALWRSLLQNDASPVASQERVGGDYDV
jgi:hypothetical protein